MGLKAVSTSGGGSGLSYTISKQFTLITGANSTYAVDSYADFAYTINGVNAIKTSSGTITAAIQINGTNVTGLSAIAVTSTPANVTATAANTVNVGDRVTVVFTSASSANNIEFNLQATRTS